MGVKVKLGSGEFVELNIGGGGMRLKQKPASFEINLCPRDENGVKSKPQRAYRGNNPRAVEAVFLKCLTDKEKKVDVFAIPEQ